LIEKIEVSMTSGDVHNFRRGEFGVESLEIDELRGLIQVSYGTKEGGKKPSTTNKIESGTRLLDKV
jgi:hypothetical protein